MSLDERDYMRERHRRLIDEAVVAGGRRAAPANVRRRGWPLVWGLLMAALSLWIAVRSSLPSFPQTGEVLWVGSPRSQALVPVTVRAPAGSWAHAAVVLRHQDSNRPVAMVPVRAGDVAQVAVPAGRYRVTMTRGLGWLGPRRLFLWNLSTHELAGGADLVRVGRIVWRYELRLDDTTDRLQLSVTGD